MTPSESFPQVIMEDGGKNRMAVRDNLSSARDIPSIVRHRVPTSPSPLSGLGGSLASSNAGISCYNNTHPSKALYNISRHD